ncbi:MAG: deoxyguanosinetriphosphate triphosphohydrolase [Planctomycetota bacterium]
MFLRELNEAREYRELAPYALKSAESRGRLHPEEVDRFRPVFLRDRDRVIHSAAFRRLEYKTQVFVAPEGDYYRTRLTHTLEVAQIARSAAYSLMLNEGFVEALSLAHDLGHPPFGHSGEKILHTLMKPYGGFEHNRQGLRMVDLLERRYPGFIGLNLTLELRESILKHGADASVEGLEPFNAYAMPFLEAQVVDLADRVAYTHHDLDDGLKAGILTEKGLFETRLWRRAAEEVRCQHPGCEGWIRVRQIINTIVKWTISDMIQQSHQSLGEAKPDNAVAARAREERLIRLSSEMETLCSEMNDYLDQHFYRHHRVASMCVRSERILTELFESFCKHPEILEPESREWAEKTGLERAVCDYIACMTDRFAEEEWKRLRF